MENCHQIKDDTVYSNGFNYSLFCLHSCVMNYIYIHIHKLDNLKKSFSCKMDSIDIRYFRKNAAIYMHLNIYLFKYVFQAINRYRLYGIEYRH